MIADARRTDMTLSDIQREIAALPKLTAEVLPDGSGSEGGGEAVSPLQIVSKQGRLILRLSAATEAMEARYRELSAQLDERDQRIAKLGEAKRDAERRVRQVALEAIHLMDALDWVHGALAARSDALAHDVLLAQRDCARRLVAVGVTEIPCDGLMDGRLHEGVDTAEDTGKPRYYIVSVVRRGYQCGPDVLRRAEVITAA
jgi:molecular chaperone GrpE (heat shock protein)